MATILLGHLNKGPALSCRGQTPKGLYIGPKNVNLSHFVSKSQFLAEATPRSRCSSSSGHGQCPTRGPCDQSVTTGDVQIPSATASAAHQRRHCTPPQWAVGPGETEHQPHVVKHGTPCASGRIASPSVTHWLLVKLKGSLVYFYEFVVVVVFANSWGISLYVLSGRGINQITPGDKLVEPTWSQGHRAIIPIVKPSGRR